MILSALFTRLFGKSKKTRRTIAEYKQELLVNQGREQFRYLLKKNLQIPVMFL